MAADRVDHAGPALLLQRLAGRAELGAVDDRGGAEPLQVVGLARPCRWRRPRGSRAAASSATATLPTPPVAPVTSTSPSPGRDAVPLQRQHAQHGGVAGGADGHGLARA